MSSDSTKFALGKRRLCVMTGLKSETSISVVSDPHNWTRKIPVCRAYADLRKAGKLKGMEHLEQEARWSLYLADLENNEAIRIRRMERLTGIWELVRPEIELQAAKIQAGEFESESKAIDVSTEVMIDRLKDFEIEE